MSINQSINQSITAPGNAQNLPLKRPGRFNIPMLTAIVILKDACPGNTERTRQVPAPLFVIQPQADEMAHGTGAVGEGLATM